MYEYQRGVFHFISSGEYLKQLKIQRHYLVRFIDDYAGPYLKSVCIDYLYHLENEINRVEKLVLEQKNKYKQERFDL